MKCIIENAGTNYSAYLVGLDGVTTTGKTVEETKANMAKALEAYKEAMEEMGQEVPLIKSEDLEFEVED